MPLYWLCYQHNNQISVVVEPATRLFMPGCKLLSLAIRASSQRPCPYQQWQVPKQMIGRRLSQEEAEGYVHYFLSPNIVSAAFMTGTLGLSAQYLTNFFALEARV